MEHFILQLPTWDGQNYFTKEIIMFILSFVAMIVGILLCFWGYKYLRGLVLLLCGCLCGYVGISLTDYLINQPIVKMTFFVVCTFFGCCFVRFLAALVNSIMKKIHIEKAVTDKMYVLTTFLGAGIFTFILYTRIYNGWLVCLAIFVVLTLLGFLYQKKNQRKRVNFYCYRDIYNMKPLKEKGESNA